MSGYTPGPWRAEVNELGAFTISAKDGPYAVLCHRGEWSHRAEESLANAGLIAAAPDLLEALKRLADYDHDPDGISLADYNAALAQARAAIAKAEGQPE